MLTMKTRLKIHDFKVYEAGYTKQVFQLLPRKLRMTCCVILLTKLGSQSRQRQILGSFENEKNKYCYTFMSFSLIKMFKTM